jgi:polyphosphate kinase
MFPVEDPRLHSRIVRELLGVYLVDNTKSRLLRSDGTYERLHPEPDAPALRAQTALQEEAVRREFPEAMREALCRLGLPERPA